MNIFLKINLLAMKKKIKLKKKGRPKSRIWLLIKT